ncbi:hypothetical protein [Pannonibacter phragmitetus]|nr:hypothetical protein [Pannonibacter phragmitetus]
MLAHGCSLAWQEKWIAGVQEGIEDAKPGGDQENRAPSEKLSEVASRCGP